MTIKKKDVLLKKVNATRNSWSEDSYAYLLSLINQKEKVLTSNHSYDERRVLLGNHIYSDIAIYNIYSDLMRIFKRVMSVEGEFSTIIARDQNSLQFVAKHKQVYYPYC